VDGNTSRYQQQALEELSAAQRALSVEARSRHELQAYVYALRAHGAETAGQPLSEPPF
jgi:hypothetical protein